MAALSCAAPRPTERPSSRAELAVAREDARREGRTVEGVLIDAHAPVAEVMRGVITPSLSRISWLLFHDPRPAEAEAREQELAHAAEAMARCFVLIPGRDKPASWTEFDLLAVIQ